MPSIVRGREPDGSAIPPARMMQSSLRGGMLSIHFVAKVRIEWREARSTCSAYISWLLVELRRSSMYSERKMSEGGWRVRRMTCAPRVANSRATSAPIPDVPP